MRILGPSLRFQRNRLPVNVCNRQNRDARQSWTFQRGNALYATVSIGVSVSIQGQQPIPRK